LHTSELTQAKRATSIMIWYVSATDCIYASLLIVGTLKPRNCAVVENVSCSFKATLPRTNCWNSGLGTAHIICGARTVTCKHGSADEEARNTDNLLGS
jgi:hypothetical protein